MSSVLFLHNENPLQNNINYANKIDDRIVQQHICFMCKMNSDYNGREKKAHFDVLRRMQYLNKRDITENLDLLNEYLNRNFSKKL